MSDFEDFLRTMQGHPNAQRIDLNREVLREMQRATDLWVVRHSYASPDPISAGTMLVNEHFVAWFIDELEANEWAELQRQSVDSAYSRTSAGRRKRAKEGEWPPGSTFAVRRVEMPISAFANAQDAEEFCERMSIAWAERTESIRRRIKERAP